jgi:hypothetical protein
VPRTAWPSARSSRASDCPRQPQPMIRHRANDPSRRPLSSRASTAPRRRPRRRTPRAPARASPRPPACVRRLEQLVELAIREVGVAPALLLGHVLHHTELEIRHRHLRLAARTPPRVVRGQHLLEVLGVERLPRLGDLTSALQAQLLEPASGVVLG